MKKIPFVIMALVLVLGLAPAGIVGANSNGGPLVINLIAGQHEVVGTVTVQEDGGQICATYALSEAALAAGWLVYETHLYIGTTDSFPLPGQYPYGDDDLGGVPDWTFCIDLAALGAETGGRLYIDACAVIRTRVYTEEEETLYLSDGGEPGQEGLYTVELVGGVAELTMLYSLTGEEYFGSVTHIGATPDGETIYVIDEDSGRLGAYSITGGTFNDLGPIVDCPEGVTQVAVSPTGELYMASKDTNRLYKVDVGTLTATDVGDTGINVMGADMAFDADGVLYLYSNDPLLRNLYTVDIATGAATLVGHNGARITGLAIRNGGRGDLVGSVNDDDTIIIIDKATGATVGDPFPMLLGGGAFDHKWGDMTVGALSQPVYEETLYLSDGGEPGQEGLYTVELVGGVAELTMLYSLTDEVNFDYVTQIGATPDGETIYAIDEDSGHLGAYSITGETFTDLGPIVDCPVGVTQVAVSLAGELYMASKDTDRLYRVDVGTLTATDVGDTGINVAGGDIAFDADGVLYLYSNSTRSLYTVDVATGAATLVGYNGVAITGLAIRNGGRGDLVGSANADDTIIIIDKGTGATVGAPFPMLLEGGSFDHKWGDMTVGSLSQPVYQEETACGSGDLFVKGTHHIVGGAAYPVNTLALLVPWLALLAVIAGASLLVLRRRQTQS